MMRSLVFGLLLAAAFAAHAVEAPAPAYKEEAEKIGQPSVIVAPDYPAEALRDKRGGVVEVTGRVSALGVLEDAHVAAVAPAGDEFAAAVREVIADWLFYVPTDDTCLPDRRTVTNRVEFSAADGKPHIAVVRMAASKTDSPAMYRAIERPEVNYPQMAISGNVEADVYARLDVGPDGTVQKAYAKAYSPRKGSVVNAMAAEVERTTERWRFPPPDDRKPWTGCYVFHFRLHR
jgi:TonB family protein